MNACLKDREVFKSPRRCPRSVRSRARTLAHQGHFYSTVLEIGNCELKSGFPLLCDGDHNLFLLQICLNLATK